MFHLNFEHRILNRRLNSDTRNITKTFHHFEVLNVSQLLNKTRASCFEILFLYFSSFLSLFLCLTSFTLLLQVYRVIVATDHAQ